MPALRNFLRGGLLRKRTQPRSCRELTEAELRHIRNTRTCPYCHGDLYERPGLSQPSSYAVLECDTPGCWSMFGIGGLDGQFIGWTPDGPPLNRGSRPLGGLGGHS